jgi:hypothetical protein
MTPECHRLAARLERARLLKRWSEVLVVAQQLQAVKDDAGNAGFAIGEPPAVLPLRPHSRTKTANWLQKWWSLAFPAADTKKAEAVSSDTNGNRFLLWVDAVGGYLVCTGDEVVLGQPVPDAHVDVPIRGDLSRRQAVIRRDREGYLIEPVRDAAINSKRIERVTLLADGDEVRLGDSVKLRFRKPHPLSHTAKLEFLSYHRTQPATDGVLLLAESCVLGPGAASHVVCPDWTHDVVLYRQGAAIGCRAPKRFRIDEVEQAQRGRLGERSRVAGDGFSFNVEPA